MVYSNLLLHIFALKNMEHRGQNVGRIFIYLQAGTRKLCIHMLQPAVNAPHFLYIIPNPSPLHPHWLDSRHSGRPAWRWHWWVWSPQCALVAIAPLLAHNPTCLPQAREGSKCTHCRSRQLCCIRYRRQALWVEYTEANRTLNLFAHNTSDQWSH